MASISLWLLMLMTLVSVVLSAENATTAAPAPAPAPAPSAGSKTPPPQQPQSNPGALASLAKMFIDIPLGIVEAIKDGAEAIETMVVAIMRGIFQ